ncbi:MAG: methyltransferase family protein [Acidimicrobiales bacterium]
MDEQRKGGGRATALGWVFVAVQAVLLVTLVALPGGTAWPTPPVVRVGGLVAVGCGLIVVVLAATGLGTALTATPVPRDGAALATSGLYRFVRHPIYSGILLAVAGSTVRAASWVTLAVALLTVVFFDAKARWEEERLAERYPGYARYAAVTPRFFPLPRRRRS